jgi:hypothetical protein
MRTILIIAAIYFFLNSCTQAIEKPLENETVELTAPVNGLQTNLQTNTFVWEELNGAVSYKIQIVSPRFDSITRFVTDSLIKTTKITLRLDSGEYQWRVKALNNSSSSKYSNSRSFRIQ